MRKNPIGVFDSGYGGLTVLKEIVKELPAYDYIYLGDNARTPYGTRSFQTVYEYTLQSVKWLFEQGCPLVILACNTASAKALRTIQQNDLPRMNGDKRVLGVIRPTSEIIGSFTKSGHVGILGTTGTVQSQSYILEMEKFSPGVSATQEACPLWVPLVENNEFNSAGADYFVKKHIDNLLQKDAKIDTILLACTHYPLLIDKISKFVPSTVTIVSQGEIIARSLKEYLMRHPEMDERCSKSNSLKFCTTGDPEDFESHGSQFFGQVVKAEHVVIA